MRDILVVEQKKAEAAERIAELEKNVEDLSEGLNKAEATRYEAKNFGLTAAKNVAEAIQLCVDQLAVVDPGFDFSLLQLMYEAQECCTSVRRGPSDRCRCRLCPSHL